MSHVAEIPITTEIEVVLKSKYLINEAFHVFRIVSVPLAAASTSLDPKSLDLFTCLDSAHQ